MLALASVQAMRGETTPTLPSAEAPAPVAVVENSHARITFDPAGGYALRAILNKQTGREVRFGPGNAGPPWRVTLLDASGAPVPFTPRTQPVFKPGATPSEASIEWEESPAPGQTLRVVAGVRLPEDSGIAEWRIAVQTRGDTEAPWVSHVDFPVMDDIQTLGDDAFYFGEWLGRVMRDPTRRKVREHLQNSPGSWSMQLAVFHGSEKLAANRLVNLRTGKFVVNGFQRGPADDETGLFLAADDAAGTAKQLVFGNPTGRRFGFTVRHSPPLPHWPPSAAPRAEVFDYAVPYAVRMGTFSGGVGQAAAIYRALVADRPWLAGGPLRPAAAETSQPERDPALTVSPKAIDCAFWGRFYLPANKVVPEIARFRDFLAAPVNLIWYRYYTGRFDYNNPDYFPSTPFFADGLRDLRALGIGAAPYTCTQTWDPQSPSFERRDGMRSVAIGPDGKPLVWMLAGRKSYWLDPSCPNWQKAFKDLTTSPMHRSWGVGGAYLDVFSSSFKFLYNETDRHPVHGGTHWADGMLELGAGLRREARSFDPEAFQISEVFSEQYIPVIDAFLMLDITRSSWNRARNIDFFPLLFSLIYHDYAIPITGDAGQRTPADKFRWQLGLAFTAGMQLSYSGLEFGPPGTDAGGNDLFLRELVHATHRSGWKFLTGGVGLETALVPDATLLGNAPAGVVSAPHTLEVQVGHARGHNTIFPWTGPSVLGSAWRAFDDSIGVTLVNISSREQETTVRVNAGTLGADARTVWRTWPLPVERVGTAGKVFEHRFKMAADSAAIFELADKAPEPRPLLDVSSPRVFLADAKGQFPEVSVPGAALWGSSGARVLNRLTGETNHLRMVSARTGKPLAVHPDYAAIPWREMEARGATRRPDDRTFRLASVAPARFEGVGEGIFEGVGPVLWGTLDVSRAGKLLAGEGATLTVSGPGGVQSGTSLDLATGSWRIAVLPTDASMPTPDSPAALGQISIAAAQSAAALFAAPDTLARLDEANRMSAVGNAAAFVLGGASLVPENSSDWIIPGHPQRLAFRFTSDDRQAAPASPLAVTIPDPAARAGLSLAQDGPDAVTLAADGIAAAGRLTRLLASRDGQAGDIPFRITSLLHMEVAEPLWIEFELPNYALSLLPEETVVRNSLGITNASEEALEVAFRAILPPGWQMPPDQNPQPTVRIAPLETLQLPLVFIRPEGPAPTAPTTIRIELNPSKHPETRISEEFSVSFDAKPDTKKKAEPDVLEEQEKAGSLPKSKAAQ